VTVLTAVYGDQLERKRHNVDDLFHVSTQAGERVSLPTLLFYSHAFSCAHHPKMLVTEVQKLALFRSGASINYFYSVFATNAYEISTNRNWSIAWWLPTAVATPAEKQLKFIAFKRLCFRAKNETKHFAFASVATVFTAKLVFMQRDLRLDSCAHAINARGTRRGTRGYFVSQCPCS